MHVKEFDLFVTVKLLEDTPAVLSQRKLCEDHGYTYHFTSGQKPQLIKDGRRIKCNNPNYVPIVVPGLSTGCLSSATPTSPTSLSQESVVPTQHSASTRSESTSSIERIRGDPLRDLPEWLEGITANLVDESVPEHRDTNPQALLVNQLQSREEKRHRAGTVCLLTSRRTEIATSA